MFTILGIVFIVLSMCFEDAAPSFAFLSTGIAFIAAAWIF